MKITLKEVLLDEFGNGLINTESNNIIIREVINLFGCDGEKTKVNLYTLPESPYATLFVPEFKRYMADKMDAKTLEEWDDIWDREVKLIHSTYLNDRPAVVITMKSITEDCY